LKAYDKDVGSSDFLGAANPISFCLLVHDDKENIQKDFTCDLFNQCKKVGQVKFTTRFVWRDPDPPPNPKLNPNCQLRLTIKKAEFLKDADVVGKQDPYIKFKYHGREVQTEVKDGAGKKAEWNEKFLLTNVQ